MDDMFPDRYAVTGWYKFYDYKWYTVAFPY